jgi:hypothetical protein
LSIYPQYKDTFRVFFCELADGVDFI